MSFHGGFLGCVARGACCSRCKRGIPILSLGDVTCAVGPIGLFLGRIANFINGELWGRPTDVPWAMVFPGGGPLPRHPSQLYEAALEGIVLFVVLALHDARRRAEAARPDRRRLRGRLCDRAHHLRVLPRARRAARLSVGRADHGHAAVAAADARPVLPSSPMRCGDSRCAPMMADLNAPLEARNPPAHSRRRADAGRAIHGALPRPSRARLLHDARSARRATAISPPRRRSARCSAN